MVAGPRSRLATLVFVAGMVGPFLGCKSSPPESDTPLRPSWKDGQVRYEIVEVSPPVGGLPESRETFELALTVQGGQAEVSERGLTHRAPFTGSGRLTRSIDETPVLYEPIALSVLPPPEQAVAAGTRWTLVRPSDEEALQAPGLVGQERFHYEIVSVNERTVEIKVAGELRLAWSRGLEELIEKNTYAPPQVVRAAFEQWSPYVDAVATFDAASGRTRHVEGVRVPFGFLRDAPVGDAPARLHFTVTEVLP